ncbi:TPA: type 1 fimbrial protein [Klebsiella pneumoniae]|nr:type 1 fimbrial protein [Klebsiella pneumoniae]
MKFCFVIFVNFLLCLFILFRISVSEANTDVHFSGRLVAEPCKIAMDSQDQNVDFGSIAARQFINNDLTLPKSFKIWLTDCDISIGQSVTFTFTGDEDPAQPGFFSVTGDAKGIALLLTDDEGNKINPGKVMTARSLVDSDNIFTFQAAVFGAEFNAIRAGNFSSTVMFSLEYK